MATIDPGLGGSEGPSSGKGGVVTAELCIVKVSTNKRSILIPGKLLVEINNSIRVL